MVLLPDKGFAVVVMANGANSNRLIRELVLAILMLATGASDEGEADSPAGDSDNLQAHSLTASGNFATSLGLLRFESETLCACIIERVLDLARFEDGSYTLTSASAGILPESYRILGDLKFSVRLQGGEEMLAAKRGGRSWFWQKNGEIRIGIGMEGTYW